MTSITNLRRALKHVLWIGGAPDSGKTTIAELLAQRYDLDVYHFDRHEMDHFARANAVKTPALWAAHPDRMSTEERWLGDSPDAMAEATIASWSERCLMAFEDIAALSSNSPIIAEGPGFFPDQLAPILTDRRRALWLIPAEAFKRRTAAARGKPGNRQETSDPELAAANLVDRDLLMGRRIQEQCTSLGLRFLIVDGNEPIDGVAALVHRQFEPLLEPCK